MILWDIIRDFFVQYIFGGCTRSGQVYLTYYGRFTNSAYDYFDVLNPYIPLKVVDGDMDTIVEYINIGDWLSTTATIITLCAICVFLFFFVRWLFRLTAGLVSGRG